MTSFQSRVSFLLIMSAALLLAGCPGAPKGPSSLTLTSVSPSTVSVNGGDRLTIKGTNFAHDMIVAIDTIPCTDLSVSSSTTATCTAPEHSPGTATLSVVSHDLTDADQLANALTYICDALPLDGLAVWANTGEDKVSKDELRATCGLGRLRNSAWDNSNGVHIFGARNEFVSFNTIIEASDLGLNGVEVDLSALSGPGGTVIASVAATQNGVFNWNQRNIEMFFVRYLKIQGLSTTQYAPLVDERHVPKRFERPWTGPGYGSGTWQDRSDHDKYYPDIAVPLELVGAFDIPGRQNQSIWTDVYIPKNANAGIYTGTLRVKVGGLVLRTIPVELRVRNFTLPDTPTAKTMVAMSYENIGRRYVGNPYPNDPVPGAKVDLVIDRHFQIAHRHKISLIDQNGGWSAVANQTSPAPAWLGRLNGSVFTSQNGYDGPGAGIGNGVFSIGTYGTWSWKGDGTDSSTNQQAMWTNTDAWESWFQQNSPATERFLFLSDQSPNLAQLEMWSTWMKQNPGPGNNLASFATLGLAQGLTSVPNLSLFGVKAFYADTATWDNLVSQLYGVPGRKLYMYNSYRPATGTFAIEDDGVALRALAWAQYKKSIPRWFYWESTYYDNYYAGHKQTDVFAKAQTVGPDAIPDPVLGETSFAYSNGDGVLFYPGTDMIFPAQSYGVDGPFASLRLKHWRRGIQDVDYLAMAAAIAPDQVKAMMAARIPKVLWEVGVSDPNDPTWVRTDISWSIDPDDWEAAREQLAGIIAGGSP